MASWRRPMTAVNAVEGQVGIFEVMIDRLIVPGKPGVPIKVRASDDTGFVHMIWFGGSAQHIDRLLPKGQKRLVTGKVERYLAEVQIVHPDIYTPEQAGEIAAIEPVYPATHGLSSRVVRKLAQAALTHAPDLPEWQDPAWRAKNRWPGWREALETLHAPTCEPELEPDAPARQLSMKAAKAAWRTSAVACPERHASSRSRAVPVRTLLAAIASSAILTRSSTMAR